MKKLILLSMILTGCAHDNPQWGYNRCLRYMAEHYSSLPIRGQCDDFARDLK